MVHTITWYKKGKPVASSQSFDPEAAVAAAKVDFSVQQKVRKIDSVKVTDASGKVVYSHEEKK